MYSVDDTIAAIASAPGGAARGIIRISGPRTFAIIAQCFEGAGTLDRRSATSSVGRLLLAKPLCAIEARLYLWPTDRSFTGQPTAEFHTIGSPPLLEAAIRLICTSGGRLAERGEFTLRAFLAGRIDLPQAEAVLGVVNAQSERQLDTALRQMAGGLSGPLNQLRDRLLNLLADLEAGLDFVEEDIQFVTTEQLACELHAASSQIDDLRHQIESRSDSQKAPRIVLRGRPNAGKSTLWNAMRSESDSSSNAIVSDLPGTTRDFLTAYLTIGDRVCELIDTAGIDAKLIDEGLNRADDTIDSAARSIADNKSSEADVVLLCVPADLTLGNWELEQFDQLDPSTTIVVVTKQDSAGAGILDGHESIASHLLMSGFPLIRTSALSGKGIDMLRSAIGDLIDSDDAAEGSALASTATRCHESLRLASESIHRSTELNAIVAGEELIADELRVALNELGKVVGAVYTDDVLDRIFSRFCIGK